MKKIIVTVLAVMFVIIVASCKKTDVYDINPISREAGSGTRDAFTAITGISESGRDMTWEKCGK